MNQAKMAKNDAHPLPASLRNSGQISTKFRWIGG